MKIIEPSLLSIDKQNAIKQLKQIKSLGINIVHYDVMDGEFVPPTALTNEYLQEMKEIGIKPNIHLMVKDPINWIKKYEKTNANAIVFHAETQSIEESKKILKQIKSLNMLAGFSIKPNTNLLDYKELFALADIILIMSVQPGWGGQGFLPESLNNLKIANDAKKINSNLIIEIDGGINFDKIKELYNSVDWFVSGSWFFKNIDSMSRYLDEFKKLK